MTLRVRLFKERAANSEQGPLRDPEISQTELGGKRTELAERLTRQ